MVSTAEQMSTSLPVALFAAGPFVPLAEFLTVVLIVTTCGALIAAFTRSDDAAPHRLSDAQLCRAWRTTTMAVRVRTAPDEQLAIAAWREEYLDEMEQRHAAGFRAWLEDGECDDEALEGFLVGDERADT